MTTPFNTRDQKGISLSSEKVSLEVKEDKTFILNTVGGLSTGTYSQNGRAITLTIKVLENKPVNIKWDTLYLSDDGASLVNRASADHGMMMTFVRE